MKVKEESEKVGLKLNTQKTKIMASGPITSWQIDGETVADFIFLGSKITADGDWGHEIKGRLLLGRKVMTNLDSILKSRDITLPKKGPSTQSYGFSSGREWMWELDYKDSWVMKNWCFWTVVLEKTLESPLNCKEIQPVHPKGVQSWVFIGRTDVETETPILWPPHVKGWLIWKDPDAGKDWGQVEKGTTGDEMVGWHHQLNGHGFGWTLGVGDGQGGLECCSPWGRKESDTTEWLNWTELNLQGIFLTQDLNLSLLHLLHWQANSLPLVPPRKPPEEEEDRNEKGWDTDFLLSVCVSTLRQSSWVFPNPPGFGALDSSWKISFRLVISRVIKQVRESVFKCRSERLKGHDLKGNGRWESWYLFDDLLCVKGYSLCYNIGPLNIHDTSGVILST